MEATSLQQLQQSVLALNGSDVPFKYDVSGDTIVGTWDISADAEGIISSESYTKHYTITVTLDEAAHTYSTDEQTSSDEASSHLLSKHSSHSEFHGKMVEKHYGMADLLSKSSATDQAKYKVSFDTSQIKKPLFEVLTQAGWTKKRGFFAKLFGK